MSENTINPINWAEKLQPFQPITLPEMDQVKLMRRTDTKFVISISKTQEWLALIQDHYRVLEINGLRIQSYRTSYFDTPNFGFFQMHHAGKANRFKVRKREYIESNLSFLEVKRKDQKAVTHKNRIPTQAESFENIVGDEVPFLNSLLGSSLDLSKVIDTNFQRITLVSIENQERLTIDLNLTFVTPDEEKPMPKVVIVELKQPKFSANSPAFVAFRKLGVRKTGMSKYCIGLALCNPLLKSNAFKPKIRQILSLK